MDSLPGGEVTMLLKTAARGEQASMEQLMTLVYDELRKLASSQMAGMASGQTLQPTALVHEAYFKLVGANTVGWESRAHFFSAAARAMRNVLVDRYRSKGRAKRGGGGKHLDLDECAVSMDEPDDDILALDEALKLLEAYDARKHEIVHLRFFAGLDNKEIAATLKISDATVERDWAFAKAWLKRAMSEGTQA